MCYCSIIRIALSAMVYYNCNYQSALGKAIYSHRRISIEPLIEHIKSVFRLVALPVRRNDKACAIVLLSVLLYQLWYTITVIINRHWGRQSTAIEGYQ